jgi:hypothetical protein
MSQNQPSTLAILCVEKLMAENIINFNNKMIDKFASRKESIMDFLDKIVNQVISQRMTFL